MWKLILVLGLFLQPIMADSSSSSDSSSSDSSGSSEETFIRKPTRICDSPLAYADEGALPQPIDTLPYKFKISSYEYSPDTRISVMIYGGTFKGFFVRAFCKATKKPIGSWERSPELLGNNVCKAAMPAIRGERDAVKMNWIAPEQGYGKLFFKISVAKDSCCYWPDIVIED
ncbi:uncharacterized protein LOC129787365 [Lutzomyia longipalpis]|uniref:uncharacterized protein LOC129787365 n=1 Tax=Lutzomyia longipalpis TaxID=7200 RepID=UPI0024841C9E|nr:uncharacterized protein LOC129787365 [Lutzomyia longipalpis]